MIDKKDFEKLENSAVKLTVCVTPDGANEVYNNLLTKYVKEVQLPGFRKGKVPKEVLVRKYGEGIRQEAAADVVDKALQEVLKDVEESPISQPVLDELPEFKPGEKYEFVVTYDVFPEIKFPECKEIEVEQPQVKILKKHEDAELEKIREQNSVVVEKEDGKIAKNNIVTMEYVEMGEDGKALEETRRKGFVFTLGKDDHPYQIEDEIKGMKAGATKVIEKTYADDAAPAVAGRTVKLEVHIESVKVRDLPELNDELAQDVSDELETLEDLRKKIKGDLKKRADEKIRAATINAITEKLVEGSDIIVPQSMITADLENTWQDYIRQSGASEDVVLGALKETGQTKEDITGAWKEDAVKSIKTRLIYGNIVETEKIEASDEETAAELEKRAEEFKMPAEELEKMFGGPQFRNYLKSELAQKKLFDFLLKSAKVNKGEKKDYTELMEA